MTLREWQEYLNTFCKLNEDQLDVQIDTSCEQIICHHILREGIWGVKQWITFGPRQIKSEKYEAITSVTMPLAEFFTMIEEEPK